jgi:cell wall-associated NlpC family hydrolase
MLRLVLASSAVVLAGSIALGVAFFAVPQASEAASKRYTQVVDNSTKGRFKVTKTWGVSTYSDQRYGKNYRFTKPAKRGLAMYKTRIPRTGFYTVCGRWPANDGYNRATPVRIKTTDGIKVRRVNQQKNGGKWVRLGTYKMKAGDGYKIQVSRRGKGTKYVISDAFKVIKASDSKGVSCRTTSGTSSKTSSDSTASKGARVVKAGENFLGKPYRLGGQDMCDQGRYIDCSCLTQKAYKAIGMSLPDDPERQIQYGRKVSTPRKGDLLFYDEDGAGGLRVTHVGIYAGNDKILHASSYWGKVVVKPMRWPRDGYLGARRLT